MTGPSLMGEKSTSPAKLGTNGWVVIRVVIVLDTAFIKKLGGFLAPCSLASTSPALETCRDTSACPKYGRLCCPCRDHQATILFSITTTSTLFVSPTDLLLAFILGSWCLTRLSWLLCLALYPWCTCSRWLPICAGLGPGH